MKSPLSAQTEKIFGFEGGNYKYGNVEVTPYLLGTIYWGRTSMYVQKNIVIYVHILLHMYKLTKSIVSSYILYLVGLYG